MLKLQTLRATERMLDNRPPVPTFRRRIIVTKSAIKASEMPRTRNGIPIRLVATCVVPDCTVSTSLGALVSGAGLAFISKCPTPEAVSDINAIAKPVTEPLWLVAGTGFPI